MGTQRSVIVLLAATVAMAACSGGGESGGDTTSSTERLITDSQRGVLLAEAACSVVSPEDIAMAFGRTVTSGGYTVGDCLFALEPGLAGTDELIIQASIWEGRPDLGPREFFEQQRPKDGIVEVPGIGGPALYDPLTSSVWILVEPSNATLPGRAAELGSIEVVVLTLQVLLPGIGAAPDNVHEEILTGLRSLSEAVAPRL